MSVTVSLHAAGCLPDSDTYPVEFESAREAWAYVADEVEQIEDDGDYLAAHAALHLIDRDQAGSIPAGADTTYAYTVEVIYYEDYRPAVEDMTEMGFHAG